MDPASGGALAAAVSAAGGLGLIGGGYGNRELLESEFAKAGNQRVGCGFITWSMAKDPVLLDMALAHRPAAMMLSFADPAPFAAKIRAAGVPMICQVHNLEHTRRALDAGADVLVAQGTDAGGHGLTTRGTVTLVPSVVDMVARERPEVLVLAAGGIADGRGIAAALMLGADGALLGTRFWATQEALIHPSAKARILAATGDETVRTSVYDIVRNRAWPAEYTGRLMRNRFIETWHGREDELRGLAAEEREKVRGCGPDRRPRRLERHRRRGDRPRPGPAAGGCARRAPGRRDRGAARIGLPRPDRRLIPCLTDPNRWSGPLRSRRTAATAPSRGRTSMGWAHRGLI